MHTVIKSSLFMALAAIFTMVSPLSFAEHGGPHDKAGDSWYARKEAEESRNLDQLNLDAKQKQKIQAIRQQARIQAQTLWQNKQTRRNELEHYLTSPNATLPAAEAKVDEYAKDMAQMGKLRVRTMFKMREVMTPEQYQKFAQLRQQQRQQYMQQHHPHHGMK